MLVIIYTRKKSDPYLTYRQAEHHNHIITLKHQHEGPKTYPALLHTFATLSHLHKL